LALIIVPLAVFTKNTPFPGWNALYPCLGAMLVIYGGASPLSGGLLRQPLLVGLGLRSYSVYLAHWPLISFYKSDTLARLTTTERIALLVASLAAGAAMYRFIEQPFRVREGRPARIPGRAAATIGLSASAVIAVVGSLLWVSDGWIARLPPELRTAVETMATEQKDYWKFAMGQKFERTDKTNVLVFGNSFGIDTYYGLRQYDALSVVYSGTTHYGCLAFFVRANASSPECLERNLALLGANDVTNADVIVLSELWGVHLGAQTYERELDRLFAAIRAVNPPIKIVLVGPRMTFVGKVVDHLIQHKSLDGAEAALSRHYAMPLNKLRDFDQTMRAHAALRNVAYVSLVDLMCGTGQCQVMTPGDHRQIYMDDGHFTRRGAEYVGRLTWERYGGAFAREHRREARLP
jgi:lysophospholipase L1-like esterase